MNDLSTLINGPVIERKCQFGSNIKFRGFTPGKTNMFAENRPKGPKRKLTSILTIHFQVRTVLLLVSGDIFFGVGSGIYPKQPLDPQKDSAKGWKILPKQRKAMLFYDVDLGFPQKGVTEYCW